MRKLKFIIALWVGKFLSKVIGRMNKERGTNYPGKIAFKISKDFIKNFKNINYDKVIFITGTNGKSTSNNMIVNGLEKSGHKVCTNLAGANLITGIATALIKDSTMFGKIKSEYCVFETDERYMQSIYNSLPTKNIAITNIQKDQVQRNGEPDFIYKKIKNVISKDIKIFVNNDEPRAKSLEDFAKETVYFGINKNDKSFIKDEMFNKTLNVTMPCPKCNHKLEFDFYNIDNVGRFKCTHCDFKSEEKPNYLMESIDFKRGKIVVNGEKYGIKLLKSFFLYDYLLAVSVLREWGITPFEIQHSFDLFKLEGGRAEDLEVGNKILKYVRIKQENPETLQSAYNDVAEDDRSKIVMIGLLKIEDIIPNYSNTFYNFDCDVENVEQSNVERYLVFGEGVAYDTALRLKYAGVDESKIDVLDSSDPNTIFNKVTAYENDNIYLITWLHEFMNFQDELEYREYRRLLNNNETYKSKKEKV